MDARSLRLLRLVAAALVTAGLALGVPLTAAAPASASVWLAPAPDLTVDPLTNLNEFENRILARINTKRHQAGLRKVRYFDTCIDGFSERWAEYLATSGEFKHRDQTTILSTCHLSWVGETLVRGIGLTPTTVVSAWMHSPEHRAVIMKPRANRAGIGVRIDGLGRIIAVLNFGDSRH